MKRDISKLCNPEFDLVIIGGGIYGAAACWEATLQGLSVALIERNDFGNATSANSQKIIHGGFRYLQHADLKRLRESVRERTNLMRIAPHLIDPLPVLIPAYGHGIRGIETLTLASKIYDFLSMGRNTNILPDKHIGPGKILSPSKVMDLTPRLPTENLTGGIIFYDAQVYNSERLVISFLKSAYDRGACLANYMEATGFILKNNQIIGVEAQDKLSQEKIVIKGKYFLNTAGPWVYRVLSLLKKDRLVKHFPLVKCFNVITKTIFDHVAVGLYGKKQYVDQDAFLNKGTRLFFVTPWREYSVIGTSFSYFDGNPDDLKILPEEVDQFIQDFNQACPKAEISSQDVTFIHKGFLPSSGILSKTQDVQVRKHYELIDHSKEGIDRLISVIGVKYTTARDVMEKTIEQICSRLGKNFTPCSSITKLKDAPLDTFTDFAQSETKYKPTSIDDFTFHKLLKNYGMDYKNVLAYSSKPTTSIDLPTSQYAQVLYSIHEEMALKLSDIILRRTEWGSAGHPEQTLLQKTAQIMAHELQWTPEKMKQEILEVEACFPQMRL